MKSRYSRQELIRKIGSEGQKKISSGRVVIIGCGASGTHIASNLVRAGVGTVHIIDRDFIETHNLQRQLLFNEDDVKNGIPKAFAAKEHLRKINSEVNVTAEVADVNFTNIENFISGFDVVVDGTDNFSIRYLINEACHKHSIPWIYGGGISTYGMSMTIIPDETPCFACQFPIQPPSEMILTCDIAGVLSSTIAVSASIQAVEVLKLLIGKKDELNKKLFYFDVWNMNFNNFEVRKNEECAVCVKKEYKILTGDKSMSITNLCGQDSVQIIDLGSPPPNFCLLEERLSRFAEVHTNKFMLKFSLEGRNFTVFKDGRTIIHGLNDGTTAKTLYNRYIGG